jgi:hypothetical protein
MSAPDCPRSSNARSRATLRALLPPAMALVVGCSTTGSAVGEGAPTRVRLSPDEFPDAVLCNQGPGSTLRYVATLIDLTPEPFNAEAIAPFHHPSSPPVDCHSGVEFEGVVPATVVGGSLVPGHQYVAEVQGFARTDVAPLAQGSPIMVSDGEVAQPLWTAICGILGGQERDAPSGNKSPTAPVEGGALVPPAVDAAASDPRPADAGVGGAVFEAGSPRGAGRGDGAPHQQTVSLEGLLLLPDAGFAEEFLGPVTPILGQTVALRGCALSES